MAVHLRGDASRSLRAAAGSLTALFVFGVARLLRVAPPEPKAPTADDLDVAETLARSYPSSYAHLALLGDKRLLFNEGRAAFLMYASPGGAG